MQQLSWASLYSRKRGKRRGLFSSSFIPSSLHPFSFSIASSSLCPRPSLSLRLVCYWWLALPLWLLPFPACTHTLGLLPAEIGSPPQPLLSPRWLFAGIIHSRKDNSSIMEAKSPSSLWPGTHSPPVSCSQHHHVWLCLFDWEPKTFSFSLKNCPWTQMFYFLSGRFRSLPW